MTFQPSKILKEAIRAVPAVKYALGVAGIVSVVAIVSAFGISPQWALIGTVVTMVLMVALVVFAKLTTTAKKHFLIPVLVLMWSFLGLTIATAGLLFSTVFFKWPAPLPELFRGGTKEGAVAAQSIAGLLKGAKLQRDAGDYEAAWKSLQEALNLQPNSAEARQEEVQLGMVWLRSIDLTEKRRFTEIVNRISPCLYQSAAQTTGTQAADIYAHIGWGNFLKFREGARDLDFEGQYKKALTLDPDNLYAHAMWGYWLVGPGDKLFEAEKHFAAALKSGREKQYIRELQLSALGWGDKYDYNFEIIRVANEMRKNHEALALDRREYITARVYFGVKNEFWREMASVVPPAEHLATFLWLLEGTREDVSCERKFTLAHLREAAGDYAQALPLYLSSGACPPYDTEISAGIVRCKQHVPLSER